MKGLLLFLIKSYQAYLSPLKRVRCPYVPSCSAYASEAVKKHGALGGGILMTWRILRCNPFSSGGIDPVPEKFTLITGHQRVVRMGYGRVHGTE